MQTTISTFDGIPITGTLLRSAFQKLEAPKAKVERLVSTGEFIRLKRNLYISARTETINNFLAANYMVYHSYVTGLSALWYNDIIPETVVDTISMTTKPKASYDNELGHFSFHSCPSNYFYIGINPIKIQGNSVFMACIEKALCDHIEITPGLNLRYIRETRTWLEDEMRMDMDELSHMKLSIIESCAKTGKKQKMLSNIIKIFA